MDLKRPDNVPEDLYRVDVIPELIYRGALLVKPEYKETLLRLATNPYPTYGRMDMELALTLMEAKKSGELNEEFIERAIESTFRSALQNEHVKDESMGGLLTQAEANLSNLGDSELSRQLYAVRETRKHDEIEGRVRAELQQVTPKM